jgi:hypothetical protein
VGRKAAALIVIAVVIIAACSSETPRAASVPRRQLLRSVHRYRAWIDVKQVDAVRTRAKHLPTVWMSDPSLAATTPVWVLRIRGTCRDRCPITHRENKSVTVTEVVVARTFRDRGGGSQQGPVPHLSKLGRVVVLERTE